MNYAESAVARLRAIVADTLANGGGTYDQDTLESVTGQFYALSVNPECERVIPIAEFSADELSDALVTFPHDAHIGTWIDGTNVYVDASTLIPHARMLLCDVLAIARDAGQLAIYDMASGQTIACS